MRLMRSRTMVVLLTATIAGAGRVIAADQTGPPAPASRFTGVGSPVNGLSQPHFTLIQSGRSFTDVELFDGSFTLTTSDGDIAGVYTGHSSISPSGRSDASLDLQVTGGTNLFQGATGSLTGNGTGAFSGEGSFSLIFRGSISTAADPTRFRVRGKVSGTSSASCASQITAITLEGDGAFGMLGDVHAVLTHLVGGSGCSP